ncbi:hypothetical protein DVDV_0409 [Desulfovibrio sp. DV]|nr:hypothetical protein DVDV_0409 [Desulfovibrio sp. DV]
MVSIQIEYGIVPCCGSIRRNGRKKPSAKQAYTHFFINSIKKIIQANTLEFLFLAPKHDLALLTREDANSITKSTKLMIFETHPSHPPQPPDPRSLP